MGRDSTSWTSIRADGVPLFVEELTKAGARNCRSQTAKRLRSLR
jgi:hypothetical protein